MTGELVKFGVVMLVVMGGFVMSFYSLLRETMTYGEVRARDACYDRGSNSFSPETVSG